MSQKKLSLLRQPVAKEANLPIVPTFCNAQAQLSSPTSEIRFSQNTGSEASFISAF